jgi:hypothetical protein
MSYEKWIQRYKPITNTLTAGSSFDGTMFETYGPEYEFVKEQAKENKVWTIRESDGKLQITAGLGWVNRLGYLVTEKPWVNQEVYIEID